MQCSGVKILRCLKLFVSVAVWQAIHACVVLRLLETVVTGYRFGTVCAIFGEPVRRKSLSRQLSVCIRINFVLDVNLSPEHNHAVFAFRLTGSHRQSYSTPAFFSPSPDPWFI